MQIPFPIVLILGWLAGIVVNLLADDLPERRAVRFPPRYPDDTPRPPIAWSGVLAFVSGRRASPGGAKLPVRHFITEIATIALFVLAWIVALNDAQMTTAQLAFWLAYMAIFALITVIDVEHRLILFVVIIPSALVALADAILTPYGPNLTDSLLGGALGFGVFFAMYLGGFLFTYVLGKLRGKTIDEVAFGYGDVMLITLSGLILGWRPLFFTIFLTVILGAIGALVYLLVRAIMRRHYSLFTPLPYGPYIVAGTLLMLLFSPEVARLMGAAPIAR